MFQETQSTAHDTDRARSRGSVPGMWWLALATVLCAIGCWFWLIPAVSSPTGNVATAPGDPVLAQVTDGVLTNAVATMNGTPDFFTRFKPGNRTCAEPLAWVMVSRRSGEMAGSIRIRSGTYISPLIEPSDVPVRVALPYPAPYETGRGTLSVLGSGARPIIALMPAWKPYVSGMASVPVMWDVGKKCARANG